jgi:hypothetical protein
VGSQRLTAELRHGLANIILIAKAGDDKGMTKENTKINKTIIETMNVEKSITVRSREEIVSGVAERE